MFIKLKKGAFLLNDENNLNNFSEQDLADLQDQYDLGSFGFSGGPTGYSSDQIRIFLDNDPTLLKLFEDLTGIKKDEQGNLRKFAEGRMNIEGAYYVLQSVRAYTSGISEMSYLEVEEVSAETLAATLNILEELAFNANKYGINVDDTWEIGNLCSDVIFNSLKKAQKGNFLKFFTKTSKSVEQRKITDNLDIPNNSGGPSFWGGKK